MADKILGRKESLSSGKSVMVYEENGGEEGFFFKEIVSYDDRRNTKADKKVHSKVSTQYLSESIMNRYFLANKVSVICLGTQTQIELHK